MHVSPLGGFKDFFKGLYVGLFINSDKNKTEDLRGDRELKACQPSDSPVIGIGDHGFEAII